MNVRVPEVSLVVLVGASGSGKSTFAAKHFAPTEILSSDRFRGIVSGDESDQSANADAFELLHLTAKKRLVRGLLTVIDATNVEREARAPIIRIARETHVVPVAIVLDLPGRISLERNATRPDRNFGPHVVRLHRSQLRQSLRGLKKEGFRRVYVLSTVEEIDAATIVREKLWSDRRDDHGPFDIIGDVHGCADELHELLARLGYVHERGVPRHPLGRKAVFLGDLVDRGPKIVGVLRTVMDMVSAGSALCIPGNHEAKLGRYLLGKSVKPTHGLAQTVEQLLGESEQFQNELRSFLDSLVSHYVLDGGRLVVAHAGLKEELHGRASGRVRQFCLYGETTGETDDLGLPVRLDWAREYRGDAAVVYGHTPIAQARWVNNTICIDTGCVFGGELTALRWPERALLSVKAARTYYEPVRPLALPTLDRDPDLLDIDDVTGKRIVDTRYEHPVTLRAENTAAALEVMSRFAIDPRWLVYLPPTMSPAEAARQGPFLERPTEAFAYYRERGVSEVVCEEKHMGSRAVVIVCRDEHAGAARFGEARLGVVYTRTGRAFFDDPAMERALLTRVRDAAERAGMFDELASDWLLLDTELMPWSAKAEALVREQYAPVGAAGVATLALGVELLARAAERQNGETAELWEKEKARLSRLERYVEAYQRYCREVASVDDLALAPFHVLASEGRTHIDRDHVWHMQAAERLAREERIVRATSWRLVDLSDPKAENEATEWWLALTSAGEGMVVKPRTWLPRYEQGLVQPALKCRGREYLRIIYGPEYTDQALLPRLRKRALSGKRRLAIKEYTLGLEALARFVDREPLYRVHECVFGVLALESEPIDPRL